MNFNTIDDMRRLKRLTIVQLCDKIGVNESTYHKWKADPRRMKVGTLEKIISVLDLSEQDQLKLFQ